MLNIRKRFFLLLTIVGLLFGIAACTNNDDYVRLSFDNDVYEVKVGQTIDVTPIVNKGSNVGAVTIEYTSYDDQIASYSNGKLQGLRVGETVIKVVCSEKPVAYDVATVRVVANSLPEVEFEPLQQNMLKGTTQTLKYHFVPEYGNALMSFTSANPEIATIDENGVITGVAKGTAVIIARATDELDSSQYRDYTFVVEVLEADFAITYELNGGTNDPTNPAGYNVLNLPIILKDATKLGHNFVGWYDNPEFSGSPITEIAANSTGDMTLYAKWEVSVFDITYELNGGINASENPDSYDVNKLPLVLGEPTKTGYNFLGWYLDDEKIDSIVEGTTGEIKLVAQWEIATYNITFDLVGGSWQDLTGIEWPYNRDRNQMVADFIVDFNKHSGKTVAADGSDFFARSWMADGSSAGYKFLTSTEYGSKWGWLLDFINDNRLANGKTALNENDNQAEARGELHNFLNACAPGDKGGNASYGCDYSTEEGTTGFWLYMVDLEEVSVPKTYTVESEDIILPEIAYKMGYTFLGWFLNGEKVEKIVKGTTGDLNFVAEWEIVEYTIEYNLNGGLFDIYLYSSREEMVDDFLTDAMAYYNKDKKPNCMVDDSGTQVGFANVFTAIYGIFSSEEYGAKWAWLKEYIIYTATDAKASLESGSEAYWRYSLGAFLFEDHRASWPASADYTNDELANGFWSLLLKEGAVGPQYTYTVNDEVILLTPTKEGSVFLGWFLNGEKIEKISKGTTGNLVLEAKWYNPDAELDIEYQLDGGVLPEGAPTTFVAKDGLAILPTPIKIGYMFKGWYEDIECTKEVTSIASGRSEGVVLYALWELETYKIEYETNGGEFLTDSVAPLYATFDELVLEFINDYSSFTGISGITAESFYGKSNQYGLYGFFKNEEMATKWNWLLNFVADMATEVGYSGKAYLMLSAGAANFNKYSRSNFAAFLQQTHLTKISPISMNFENVDSEALWAVCPTKDIQIGIEAQYEYTILDLPLELATPNKEGATFIGWYTNSDLKNGKIDKLTVDNIGNIKLYARWSDSTIHFDTFNIHYELDGGVLEEGAPTSYVEETGVALKGATRPGYTFQGWYLDAECTKGVTEITAQDKGDITLYACWEAVTYTVTYEVGEGALPVETVRVSGYDNLEQIIEDLLKDYSSYTGVTYNTPADLGTSAWPSAADRNFGTFYLSNVNGVNMYEKYAWFLEYLLAVNTSGEYPRILAKYKNPATCKEVADETYAFYYAFKGFVQAMQYRSGNAYWETANYADEAILNKALDFAPDAVYEEKPVSAEFTLETLPFELPIPTAPEGQKFVGWYQNSEFTGSAISAIEEGTIGDQTLYAKYESSDVEVKHSIEYVLNGATLSENAEVQYIQGVGLLITATAFKEGYEFKGWYLDSNYSKEITKIDENSIGKVTLYAKLVIKTFEIHLVGTDLTTPLILEYGALLPTPVKEGHIFKGWYDNPECVGEMVTVVTKDGTYYACWEENIQVYDKELSELLVDANNPEAYKTLQDAIAAAKDGSVIRLVAGEYSLGGTLSKNIKIVGPNEGISGYDNRQEEAIINTERVDLASAYLAFDGVKLQGSDNNFIYATTTTQDILIQNCLVDKYNSFIRFEQVAAGGKIAYLNNKITNITQFFLWLKGQNGINVKSIDFIGNMVDTYGSVSTFGMLRVSTTGNDALVINVFDNYFVNPASSNFIFRTASGTMNVKYNTFKGVSNYLVEDSTGQIIFDNNLYLDKDGNVATSVPTGVAGSNVTADENMAVSEDNRALLYNEYVNTLVTYRIKYFANGGSLPEGYNTQRVNGKAELLPFARLTDHYFIGWCLNEDLSDNPFMILPGTLQGNVTVYAKYQEIPVYNINYVLDGGTLPENAPISFKEGTSVNLVEAIKDGAFFAGWYDNPELTGNPITIIESSVKNDITLYAKWTAYNYKNINYVLDGGTLSEDAPTNYVVTVGVDLSNVVPTKDGYKFLGWFDNAEGLGNPITEISKDAEEDITLYALWQDETINFDVTYVLNGGSLIYEDRDALLVDFLKDYNEAMGKSYQTTADIPTGAFADIDYHTFFTKVLSDGTNIRGKWLWLAEYLLELSKRDLASNNCNVLGLTALINNNAYTGDAIYGLSYAFRAFLIGTTIRPGSSYSSVDHSIYENAHGFWDKLSAAENTEYLNNKGTVTLPTAYLENYKFVGWYTNPEFTGEVVTTVEDTITVYAKFVEATPVESVSIDNKITELKRYETYQLEWSINPSNANIQAVKFESSDTSVATVDNKGLITAVSNGTVTIKMTSLSPSGKTDEFTFEVYSPDHFDINYETNSYVEIGKSILLLADYVKRDGSKVNLVWSSLTPEIASVDAGAVTGLKAGQAVIRVALADDANIYQDFVVTVLDSNLSDALKYVLSAHESNAFLSYDLGIGAGTPAYYRDIVGSVSKLLYNEPLTINDQYYATANANEKNHGGKMSSIEFITVHYTGNMAKGSTASANANYFATNTSTSIHYVTGNDGVFSVLDDSYVAYHAGDGTSVKFEWFPTGVTYKDGDPVYPIFGITANSKFSINGTETTISVPEGTTAATKKVTDSKWINDMGLAFKIVDGQYYMGTTWWCYSQVAEGRICSKGGNLNSIGIESAVNPESNLWYTWQRTAQLVAKLMLENDLDITRVKGHHFYSAKDCPQPLLENDLEIWWKFIEMVEHEYDMLTKYKDYQFTFELDTETTAVNNNGRVVEQPLYTEVVTYTVTIDNGTTSETITLSTIVEGMYCK